MRQDQSHPRPKTAAAAIRRSLDIYYRDDARTRRMDALNALFVRPGSLAFDIGSHVGDRAGSFLRLGAKVVAAEPQPALFRAMQLIHGRNPDITLIRAAVGADLGVIALHVNSANPTVSTVSTELMEAASSAETWQGQVWDRVIEVPVTTLDALVAEHGVPDFVKIDVEGHELAVLQGLGTPLPALSFEFTTIQRQVALDCIGRLAALGDYSFNISFGEEHALRHTGWQSAAAISAEIANVPDAANSGDIFARLEIRSASRE
jgi:FkbM family methyltransferase